MSALNRLRRAQAAAHADLVQRAEAAGRPVQCRGLGCNGCCRGLVGLSWAEWAAIRRRLTDDDLRAIPDPRTVDLVTLRCPLLDAAGGCRIYSDRPIVCRGYAALTPPERCDTANGPAEVHLLRDVVTGGHEKRQALILVPALAEEARRRGIPLIKGALVPDANRFPALDRQVALLIAAAVNEIEKLRQSHGDAWAGDYYAAVVFHRLEQGARGLGAEGWEGLVGGILVALPADSETEAQALLALIPETRREAFAAVWTAQREAWALKGPGRPFHALPYTTRLMELATEWTPTPAGSVGHRLGTLWVLLHQEYRARQFHLPRVPDTQAPA